MIKLVRVLTYEYADSEAEHARHDISKSGIPMNGKFNHITSIVAGVESFPCLICGSRTNLLTLVCEECTTDANNEARLVR